MAENNVIYLARTIDEQTEMGNVQMSNVLATVKAIESRLPKSLDAMSNQELMDNLAVDNWAQKAGDVLCVSEDEKEKNSKIMADFLD